MRARGVHGGKIKATTSSWTIRRLHGYHEGLRGHAEDRKAYAIGIGERQAQGHETESEEDVVSGATRDVGGRKGWIEGQGVTTVLDRARSMLSH
jgi:hypothetical protein